MIRLDGFWDFIWCRPGLSASADEWRRCLGDDGWQLLRKRLFTGDGIAHTCTRPDGRTLQVVPMSRGTYGLICPATGNVEKTGLAEAGVILPDAGGSAEQTFEPPEMACRGGRRGLKCHET